MLHSLLLEQGHEEDKTNKLSVIEKLPGIIKGCVKFEINSSAPSWWRKGSLCQRGWIYKIWRKSLDFICLFFIDLTLFLTIFLEHCYLYFTFELFSTWKNWKRILKLKLFLLICYYLKYKYRYEELRRKVLALIAILALSCWSKFVS